MDKKYNFTLLADDGDNKFEFKSFIEGQDLPKMDKEQWESLGKRLVFFALEKLNILPK